MERAERRISLADRWKDMGRRREKWLLLFNCTCGYQAGSLCAISQWYEKKTCQSLAVTFFLKHSLTWKPDNHTHTQRWQRVTLKSFPLLKWVSFSEPLWQHGGEFGWAASVAWSIYVHSFLCTTEFGQFKCPPVPQLSACSHAHYISLFLSIALLLSSPFHIIIAVSMSLWLQERIVTKTIIIKASAWLCAGEMQSFADKFWPVVSSLKYKLMFGQLLVLLHCKCYW